MKIISTTHAYLQGAPPKIEMFDSGFTVDAGDDRIEVHGSLDSVVEFAASILSAAVKLRAKQAVYSGPWVYFIQAMGGGPIKIGWAQSPNDRLKAFQVGNYEKLSVIGFMRGGVEMERRVHGKFNGIQVSGEWFEATKELVAFISKYGTQDEEPWEPETDESPAEAAHELQS